MTRQGYGKLSNGFHANTKVKKLRRMCPTALGVYCMAISYCSDVLNDGVMSEDDVLYQLDATEEEIAALVKVGLFDRLDDGSYCIHDYLSYQSSRQQVEERAENARDRKRRQRDNATVTPESQRDSANVTSMSRRDNATVTPESQRDSANVTSMSRRDNATVTPESREDSLTKNQEPRTKESSNEDSLPQTPSRGPSESQDEEYPLAFEQFWVTYPRKEGKRKALAAWKRARRKTNNTLLVAKASLYQADPNRDPGYTLTPANWLDGEHWLDDPLPEKRRPGQPDPQAEKTARLRDVDWLCTHVDDPEAQDAALELPEKSQALARARYPDEWYRLWRRGMKRREQAKQREAKQEATP